MAASVVDRKFTKVFPRASEVDMKFAEKLFIEVVSTERPSKRKVIVVPAFNNTPICEDTVEV